MTTAKTNEQKATEAKAKEEAEKKAAAEAVAQAEEDRKATEAKAEPTIEIVMLRGYFPTEEEQEEDDRKKWPKGEEMAVSRTLANSLKKRKLADIVGV